MSSTSSSSEWLALWRQRIGCEAGPCAEETARELFDRLQGAPPEEVKGASLTRIAHERARSWCADDLLPRLVDELVESRPDSSDSNRYSRISAEVRSDVRKWMPEVDLALPAPTLEISTWAWALVAFVGAVLGVMLVPRLMRLTWGDIEVGKLLGGPVGAAALVMLIAWLRSHPKLRSAIEKALAAGAVAAAVMSLWTGLRGRRRRGALGWLKTAGLFAVAGLLLLVSKPRPRLNDEEAQQALSRQLGTLFRWYANITVLLLHARLLGEEKKPESIGVDRLFAGLSGGLQSLLLAARSGDAPGALDGARQVLSELEAQDIKASLVDKGTLFDDSVARQFETFGIVEAGDPVEMLRPAWIAGEQVLLKGQVRRLRNR